MTSATPLPPAVRTAGRIAVWTLGIALVLGAAAAAWIAVRGAAAISELREAQGAASGATQTLRDPAAAAALIDDISGHTRAARELTDDPIWRGAESLPWVGPQLHAFSTVADTLDAVASDALTPLATLASTFSIEDLRPSGGRIDLAPIIALQPAASRGAQGLADANAAVGGIDRAPLLGPVRDAVDEVSSLLADAAQSTDALARATALMPAMLGADGPRNYLVVFQNNAEWRSLGGIVGAMSVIRTDGGGLSLAGQGSSSDFSRYDEPVLPLDPALVGIFGTHPARWIQNVTQVPTFPLTAQLAREMWLRETGLVVDGVLSLDPVALSYLLEATGPVTLPTGEQLTSENAVSLLLNEVYFRYERPADQDIFFAAAAAAVFDTLASGNADPTALIAALARAGEERRLLLWNANPEEQEVLAGTTLTGPLPFDDDDQRGFGVYLNDGTGSKMDYYASVDTTLTWTQCPAPGTGGEVTLSVTIGNNAPADAATSLPAYITGGGAFGVPAGFAKTVTYLYLPEGGLLVDSTLSTGGGFGGGFDQDRQVLSFSGTLAPGETMSATATVRFDTPGPSLAAAWITPTVNADAPTRIEQGCSVP